MGEMLQMGKRNRQQPAGGTLGLLEESVGVLRRSAPGTLGCYYIGSLPFIMALLYFLTDVTQGAFASKRLVESSAVLAGAFIWMKFWHAVFTGRIMEQLCGQQPQRWGLRRICRVAVGQAAIQPWGLIMIPLATVIVFPLPWAYAFFQNASVYGSERTDHPGGRPLTSAWRQARVWPGQNVATILILMLFGFFVLVNLGQAIMLPPELAKMFLNIDSVFTRGGFSAMNTTFLSILLSLGYLCLDPLIKAFYTLRCFYGQSLQTGQDLRSELRAMIAAGCVVVCLTLLGATNTASAKDAPPPAEPAASTQVTAGISPQELDKSFDEVLSQRKYAWRLRRAEDQNLQAEEESFASAVLDTIWEWIKYFLNWLGDIVKEIWDFLFPRPERYDPNDTSNDSTGVSGTGGSGQAGWVSLLRYVVYATIVALVIVLGAVLWKKFKLSQTKEANVTGPEMSAIDLEDENVTADDLPESGWLDLARRLVEQGDSRLALRAMYLASLSMLAANSRISIAKFKSNLDYRRELARRCHSMPLLLESFGRNVGVFEAVWYGTRQATEQVISTFIDNQRTIGQMVSDA
jgi:hypothetical protein